VQEVSRLEDDLQAETPQTGTLEALQRDLEEQQEAHRLHSETYQDSIIAKDQAGAEQKQLLQQMNEMDIELKDLEARIAKANERVTKLNEVRIQAVMAKNECYASIEDAKRTLEHIQAERNEQADIVKDHTEKASEVSLRVPVDSGETTESLDKRLMAMRREIERNESA
jgi:chromosome segregation ATPase